jgi:hypothetical protein
MNSHICDTFGMNTHHYDLYTLFNFNFLFNYKILY